MSNKKVQLKDKDGNNVYPAIVKQCILDVVYPVGSIYMSVNSTSPQTLFGGTWERIQDKFLLASGSLYSAGTTGGSANAVVVSHRHDRIQPVNNPDWKVGDGTGLGGVTSSTYINKYKYEDLILNSSATLLATNYAGESGTDKNMPPYLAVCMWKRTA